MTASYQPYTLQFKTPVLTSRGSMQYKNGYYIAIEDKGNKGVGECSYIEGLSIDRLDSFEQKLRETCAEIWQVADEYYENGELPAGLMRDYPALAFGLEAALLDLSNGGRHEIIAGSAFLAGKKGIPVNGLVWMGSDAFMQQQIEQKLAEGFRCIKIKVGAIGFSEECRLIEGIRKRYAPAQIEIRLDANGGFNENNVRERLHTLSQFAIHSIEQPVKPQQYLLMHRLCAENIIPIALDEELIGTWQHDIQHKLLETIRPQYIILKPSLLGGLAACDTWIKAAGKLHTGWWATSALESNVGLNAIAQWVAAKDTAMVQGLGTGSLYQNNISSPLYIQSGHLRYDAKKEWAAI
jgi:o-succinylbenzoate synthase